MSDPASVAGRPRQERAAPAPATPTAPITPAARGVLRRLRTEEAGGAIVEILGVSLVPLLPLVYLVLTLGQVQTAARYYDADHLAGSPTAAGFADLRVAEPTGSADGRTAQVTLTARARPAVVPWVLVPWSDGFTITATVSARAD